MRNYNKPSSAQGGPTQGENPWTGYTQSNPVSNSDQTAIENADGDQKKTTDVDLSKLEKKTSPAR